MQLGADINENSLKSIVTNVEQWVKTVTHIYNNEQKRLVYDEQERKEQERLAKIQQLEKENALASLIAKL